MRCLCCLLPCIDYMVGWAVWCQCRIDPKRVRFHSSVGSSVRPLTSRSGVRASLGALLLMLVCCVGVCVLRVGCAEGLCGMVAADGLALIVIRCQCGMITLVLVCLCGKPYVLNAMSWATYPQRAASMRFWCCICRCGPAVHRCCGAVGQVRNLVGGRGAGAQASVV